MNCKVNVIIQLLSVSFWKLSLHVYQVPHLYAVFFRLPLYWAVIHAYGLSFHFIGKTCWLCRLCCQIISIVDKFPQYLSLRGFLHEKTRTGASFIQGWLFHFVIHMWCKITNIAHGLLIPVYQQTDFTPKRVVILCLHDTVARFCTRVEFSPQYNNQGELTPGWLALAWHFVVVSCNKCRAMRDCIFLC